LKQNISRVCGFLINNEKKWFGRFEVKGKDIRGDLLVHVKNKPYDVVEGVKDGGGVQGI